MTFRLNSFSFRIKKLVVKLQFHLLLAVPKDIVTFGGKLNGAYARNAGRSYTKTAYDRVRRRPYKSGNLLHVNRSIRIGKRSKENLHTYTN